MKMVVVVLMFCLLACGCVSVKKGSIKFHNETIQSVNGSVSIIYRTQEEKKAIIKFLNSQSPVGHINASDIEV